MQYIQQPQAIEAKSFDIISGSSPKRDRTTVSPARCTRRLSSG